VKCEREPPACNRVSWKPGIRSTVPGPFLFIHVRYGAASDLGDLQSAQEISPSDCRNPQQNSAQLARLHACFGIVGAAFLRLQAGKNVISVHKAASDQNAGYSERQDFVARECYQLGEK
jgi:hypothetical protein